jgi:hypothetical protein
MNKTMFDVYIKTYQSFLLSNQSLWFKYKKFLDNQLDYCYHMLNEDKNEKTDVKDSK